MVALASLWLPILLSAILVFVVSAVIHMLLPYHRNEFGAVPAEAETMTALRNAHIPPGEYVMPYAGHPDRMKDPEYLQKWERGPVAFLNVLRPGKLSMAPQLSQWFGYTVVVSFFAAYLSSRALGPGAAYGAVFRFVSTIAFVGYALALWQQSIWYRRPWSTTLKHTFDGLIYALLTAGVFGWLWPQG